MQMWLKKDGATTINIQFAIFNFRQWVSEIYHFYKKNSNKHIQ